MGLYDKTTISIDYYSGTTTGSEANMRQEMINTLIGSDPEIAKGQTGLIRVMRRDTDGKLIPCECVDNITGEPDKDRFCSLCFSEGYRWDEEEFELR